ncbi:MAG TPA: DUF4342 domain-containing protein [Chloroflexota bacterium]|nr:DUF4342 domain-containing protein [Chloroflexota bacterium]
MSTTLAKPTPQPTPTEPGATYETIKAEGAQLIDVVKRVLHEGNARRIVVKKGAQTIVEFPLTVGVVGAVLAPVLAAAGAIAALVTDCDIEVERTDAPAPPPA